MNYVCRYLFLRFNDGQAFRQINPSQASMNLQYIVLANDVGQFCVTLPILTPAYLCGMFLQQLLQPGTSSFHQSLTQSVSLLATRLVLGSYLWQPFPIMDSHSIADLAWWQVTWGEHTQYVLILTSGYKDLSMDLRSASAVKQQSQQFLIYKELLALLSHSKGWS